MNLSGAWVTFLQWSPVLDIVTGATPVRSPFEWLANTSGYEVPDSLPVLRTLGKVTPLSLNERLGLESHHGTEALWRCLGPLQPVQVVPQLDIQVRRQDAGFSRPELRAYLHPLGCVFTFRFKVEPLPASEALNGFHLARTLNNIERNRTLAVRGAAYRGAKSVVELFDRVRRQVMNQVFAGRVPLQPMDQSFCLLDLSGPSLPASPTALLASSPNAREELLSALERRPGNQRHTAIQAGKLVHVQHGRQAGLGPVNGWTLCTANGMAAHIAGAEDPGHARRAALCHHKNAAKLLGFFRLYQSYLQLVAASRQSHFFEPGAARPSYDPVALLDQVIGSYDQMAVQYSRWWTRWGAAVLALDKPVELVAGRYGIRRRGNHNVHQQRPDRAPLPSRTSVFVSYSHHDQDWLDKLMVHLRPLARNSGIDVWADTRIQPGSQWANEIATALHTAKAAVLLVSGEFLASEFIANRELPVLLERSARENLKVLPLIVSPCRFEDDPQLSRFQTANPPDRTLLDMEEAEQQRTFVNLSREIERIMGARRP